MAGREYRIEPATVLAAVEHLRLLERFSFSWPEVSGARDDPVVAAVAELGVQVQQVVDETLAMVEHLAGSAEGAVAAYQEVDQAVPMATQPSLLP